MKALVTALCLISLLSISRSADAQTIACGIGELSIGAAGEGDLNGLQITVIYPGSQASVLCSGPNDPLCQVDPRGPFADPLIFNTNTNTAGTVVTAVAQLLTVSSPAPIPEVLNISFVYIGTLPSIDDFFIADGYFTDVDGARISTAQTVKVSVTQTGTVLCPEDLLPGNG